MSKPTPRSINGTPPPTIRQSLFQHPLRHVTLLVLSAVFLVGCGGDFNLNVAQSVNGSITSEDGTIDCGTECSGTYARNSNVVLNAVPDPDHVFLNWTGACSGIDTHCALTMTSNTQVGASFSAIDEPNIGATFNTVAGSTIDFTFTGSTDFWDHVGLFEPSDPTNENPVSSVRVGVGPGISSFRVPTDIPAEGKEYQLRMYNNDDETIVIDDNIFIADYDAAFTLSTTSTTPEAAIVVTYSGSTDFWDTVATFRIGAPNSEPFTSVRIGSAPEGSIELKAPWEEGEYEVRMLNNNDETIVAGPNITLAYGPASVTSNTIVTPQSPLSVDYSGATDFWDAVSLYAQEANAAIESARVGPGSGSVTLTAPEKTGIYDLRLENGHEYIIESGNYVAVLNATVAEIFSAPEIAEPGQTITVAFSGSVSAGGTDNWVGIFEQGSSNSTPLSQVSIGTDLVGFAELTAPVSSGAYEIRLIDGTNTTLAVGNYLSVLDTSEDVIFLQNNTVAGETLRFVYAGSTDFWDYAAIYAAGETDPDAWLYRLRVGSNPNGFDVIRMPTIPGEYEIRLINTDNDTIAIGNEFTVAPYSATLSLSRYDARPQEMITATYTGLTNFWDVIAFFEPGAPNASPVKSIRLGSQFSGTVSIQVPSEEGTYDIRLLNNSDELILDGGTLNLSYDSVSISTVNIAHPAESITIAYSGSTDFWDTVGLYAQDDASSTVSHRTDGVESGDVTVTAPSITGVYNLKLANGDDVLMAEGDTLSVLDASETAVFVGHTTAIPNESLTIAYSGSTGSIGLPDSVGIFTQGTDNSAPLQSVVLPVGNLGAVTLAAPAVDGIYEVRLFDGNGDTLAQSESYLRVIDSTVDAIHTPINVVAGETHKVIYSGSTDFWDYAAIYAESETNPSNYLYRVRVTSDNGYMAIRLPTIAGNYRVRLIDTNDGVIAEGNAFTVTPYTTTISTVSVTTPADTIEVNYTGTTNFWDRVAVYEIGQTGGNYIASARIPETGNVALLTVPTEEGVYEIKAVNNNDEIMVEAGTITLTYDTISISAPSIVSPEDTVSVTYDGSTQFWDEAVLFRDNIVNKTAESELRIGSNPSATVELAPVVAGIYGLEMVNTGGIQMADGGTVASLDPSLVAVYSYPRISAPTMDITLAYSGSNTNSNTVGIYVEDSENNAPLQSVNTTASEGTASLAAPTGSGVYDIRLINLTNDTLVEGKKLYVLDKSVTGIYGQREIRAGETLPIIFAGNSDFWDKAAYYPVGAPTQSSHAISSTRVGTEAGAINMRAPTIEGEYELRLTNTNDAVIATSTVITVLPYEGEVTPE